MSKTKRVGKSFSTLPFDGIDNPANVFLHDDFITTTAVADLVDANGTAVSSELEWLGTEPAGAGVAHVDLVAGTAGHPGVISLNTGATIPADGDSAALLLGGDVDDGSTGIVLDTNGVYIATIMEIVDVDATRCEFGLIGQAAAAVNSSVADAVNFVWDPEDAANVGDELFIAQVNAGGTDTEEAFTLKYVESDWVLLEIYATSTDAYFRMTTEDGQETIHLAQTMPTVNLRPAYVVEAVGGAEELINIDAFHMRYQRSVTAANKGIGWLGATGA